MLKNEITEVINREIFFIFVQYATVPKNQTQTSFSITV